MNGCKVCPESIKQSQTKESPIDPNTLYRYVHPSLVDRFSSQKHAAKKDGAWWSSDHMPGGIPRPYCSESIPMKMALLSPGIRINPHKSPMKMASLMFMSPSHDGNPHGVLVFFSFFTWKIAAGVFRWTIPPMKKWLHQWPQDWAIQTLQPRAGGSIAYPPGRFPWEPVGFQVGKKIVERFLAVSGADFFGWLRWLRPENRWWTRFNHQPIGEK